LSHEAYYVVRLGVSITNHSYAEYFGLQILYKGSCVRLDLKKVKIYSIVVITYFYVQLKATIAIITTYLQFYIYVQGFNDLAVRGCILNGYN